MKEQNVSFWGGKIEHVEPIDSISKLPTYGYETFFKYIGPFKRSFSALTSVHAASAALGFIGTWLISQIISDINTITSREIFTIYFPTYATLVFGKEVMDYFTRKYSEALPDNFIDYMQFRIYKAILAGPFHNLTGYPKERLQTLIDKYLEGCSKFLNDWIWTIPRLIVELVIIIVILSIQSPTILAINAIYIVLFLVVALRISSRFSKIAKAHSKAAIDQQTIFSQLGLGINTLRSLSAADFFERTMFRETDEKWSKFRGVRDFHAARWLLQLNLYNLIFVITFFVGVHQVVSGSLPLGYLLLLHWAYGRLWSIVVYIIEFRVELLQQKENSDLLRSELLELLDEPQGKPKKRGFPAKWRQITIKDAVIGYGQGDDSKDISIPNLTIRRGDKLGILGASGSGKSSIVRMLIGVADYEGAYMVDGVSATRLKLDQGAFSVTTHQDSFFSVSIRDNLTLGRDISDSEVYRALEKAHARDFVQSLDMIYGKEGHSYSTGQLQRLRIARLLLHPSEVYILDEALSGIDKTTKSKILKMLSTELKGKTTLFITHSEDELSLVSSTAIMQKRTLLTIR